jgi:hypothetical protein
LDPVASSSPFSHGGDSGGEETEPSRVLLGETFVVVSLTDEAGLLIMFTHVFETRVKGDESERDKAPNPEGRHPMMPFRRESAGKSAWPHFFFTRAFRSVLFTSLSG